jgi:hypothetical protein
VGGEPGAEQTLGLDLDRRRAPDGLTPALELVDRQIDAVRIEPLERTLEAFP